MGRRKKLTIDQFNQQKRQAAQPRPNPQQTQQQQNSQRKQKKQKRKKDDKGAAAFQKNVVEAFQVHYEASEKEKEIQECVKEVVELPNESKMDAVLLNYLASVLEAQNDEETYMDERSMCQWIVRVLNSHCGMHDDDAAQKQIQQQIDAMLKTLKEKKLVEERLVDEVQTQARHVHRLKEAVSLGKEYEDQENKHRQQLSATMDQSKWNDDLDWDRKMMLELQRKKEKRVKKERQAQQKEYEQFLERRGMSLDMKNTVVKIHRREDSMQGSRDVKLERITLRIGDRTLLDDSSLNLVEGGKYGLIGRNGIGKTTLLRNIFERDLPGIPIHLQILHVEQEMPVSEKSALELVLETDFERNQLMREEKRLLATDDPNVGEKLQEVYEQMELIDAHSAESRAASILSGLSFDNDMMHTPSKHLSGGWRMRIALARALFVEPDVLLLDEPNNHLDLQACVYLEECLRNYKNTLVLVSHARSFLNGVVDNIIHFTNQRKLEHYKGNYDTFENTRSQRMATQQRQYETQQKQKEHLQKYIDKFRYKAATAKMAQSRIKLLNKMNFIPEIMDDPEVNLKLPEVEEVAQPHIQIIDAAFGWGKKTLEDDKPLLFKDVHFNISMDSRVALVGANGAGKSTFLKMILQEIEPLVGEIQINRKLRIRHFSQHHAERLDPKLSPVEFMQQKYAGVDVQDLRAQLGSMGVHGDLQTRPIYTLSGGQKSRVSFADITFEKPHILLLDEVSNYLDMDTIDALIHAFNNYKGGILLISHDEYLIERVCDEIWVCGDGKIKPYKGDFQQYKAEQVKKFNFA